MDLGTRGALDETSLCFLFLLGPLWWRLKMGYNAKLEAMQSHSAAQTRKRQRPSVPQIGLLSLCREGSTSHTSDDCRNLLERKFYTHKESLIRFASSSPPLHRTSLFSKASSSNFKFTLPEASLHDSHRLAHPASSAHDAHPCTEGPYSNDALPEHSGWHLVSRRHSFRTPQPSMKRTSHTLTSARHTCESSITEADALKARQPCVTGVAHALHPFVYPGTSVATEADSGTMQTIRHQSAVAVADALRLIQPCVAGTGLTLHPPVSPGESISTEADAGTAHMLVALRHRPGSPCESDAAAAAADALVSLNDATTPAALVDVIANVRVSPLEPCARNETMSATYQAPQTLSTLARTGCAPVTAPLVGLHGSHKEEVVNSHPVYKQLLESRCSQESRLKDLMSQISATESHLKALQITRKEWTSINITDGFDPKEISMSAAFLPLSKEEEEEVHEALNGANRHQVLVQHEPSNIDISRATLQCLKPGAWLNDEVINLYMELLKERERREQKDYLKCHFFNTFFFNKLYKDAHSYDFKAVRRWTTQRKLGYSLLECDKIFVPIHKDIHWCLAVINIREKRLQYLDSLKGHDGSALQVLARYIKDEAKDKGVGDVDTGSWRLEWPKDIPAQMNGCDCGMFMIKYADFLSRGNELKFTQEHMDYFRKRTALELLQLKAR